MTTIMAFGNSEETRRCDARCHDAAEAECDCICGGRYHGKGREAQELLQQDVLRGVWGEALQEGVQVLTQQALEVGA